MSAINNMPMIWGNLNGEISSERSWVLGKMGRTWKGFFKDWFATFGWTNDQEVREKNFSERWTLLKNRSITIGSVKSGHDHVGYYLTELFARAEGIDIDGDKYAEIEQLKGYVNKKSTANLRTNVERIVGALSKIFNQQHLDSKKVEKLYLKGSDLLIRNPKLLSITKQSKLEIEQEELYDIIESKLDTLLDGANDEVAQAYKILSEAIKGFNNVKMARFLRASVGIKKILKSWVPYVKEQVVKMKTTGALPLPLAKIETKIDDDLTESLDLFNTSKDLSVSELELEAKKVEASVMKSLSHLDMIKQGDFKLKKTEAIEIVKEDKPALPSKMSLLEQIQKGVPLKNIKSADTKKVKATDTKEVNETKSKQPEKAEKPISMMDALKRKFKEKEDKGITYAKDIEKVNDSDDDVNEKEWNNLFKSPKAKTKSTVKPVFLRETKPKATDEKVEKKNELAEAFAKRNKKKEMV